jgi:Ca-activated chloride channel family protein
MHFGDVNALGLLWIVPALVLLFVWAGISRRRAINAFVDSELLDRIRLTASPQNRRWKAAIVVLAFALIAVSLARPAWNPKPQTVERRGRDIVFILDVSRSMLAEDLAPNRLERAKIAIKDLVDRLEGDRVALVAFAGTAVLKCPLTLDYGFFEMMLDGLDPTTVSRGGTMIGDAIRKALDEAYDDQERKYKDIILITDGEDHDSFPVEAAGEAGQRGVRIIAVGLGDEDQGKRIPVTDERGNRSFLTYQGREIWSRLDAEMLRRVVNATPGGRYLNVSTGTIDLGAVYGNLIAGEEKREIESLTIKLYEEKFQIFLGFALFLLFVEMFIGERRRVGRSRATLPVLVTAAALLLLSAVPAAADSPRSLVKRGNRSLEKGELDHAIELYERASVDAPESPIIALNTGNAHFLKEEWNAAREYFEKAALRSEDLGLEAEAWYNLGNTAFRQAERQEDSDLEKSLEHYQEAVRFYQTALEKDPGLEDAAFNLEVTRLTIKDLLDRINKQREMMEQQREKMQEVVDSLRSLARREEHAARESGDLGSQANRGPRWERRLEDASGGQQEISGDTDTVREKLNGLFPGDQRPQPVEQALSHIDSSLADQSGALEGLARKEPRAAEDDQDRARGQLEKAIEALTEGQQPPEQQQEQQQQQQGDQQQDQQERPQEEQPRQEQRQEGEKRDETARNIIEEEKENNKRRQEEAARGYKRVDKDW